MRKPFILLTAAALTLVNFALVTTVPAQASIAAETTVSA
jgi:hypothetical protein